MEENYDLEKIITQFKAMDYLEKVQDKDFEKLGLTKKSIGKFRKYTKKRYEDILKGFE